MCDFKKMFNFKNERNMKTETKRILEKAQAGDAEAQYLTGLYYEDKVRLHRDSYMESTPLPYIT